jgi:K+-sensing histidine kinase KdpD
MNRLLILDDNERFAAALERNITGFDEYETEHVQIAVTSSMAIDFARRAAENQEPFTIFLIDQNLDAEMDGIQAMKELLAISPDADTIIFTGFETPQDGMRAYEEGASRYLPKPFEPRELAFILKDLSRSRKVRLEEARQRRQFKIAKDIAEAVGASLNLESTMDAVIGTLSEMFEKTRLCVLLYDQQLNILRFAPATLKYYEIENPQYTWQDTFPLDQGAIACRVAKKVLATMQMECENVGDVSNDKDYINLNPRTKSECCVGLLNSNNKLLGVLALEREWLNGFGEGDLDLITIAARHISIAIERAQQSEELDFKSTVAAQTSWAANIAHEINNEVSKIVNWAYFIKKSADENSMIWEYAKNIEESAYQLSSANPWTARPAKSVEIDTTLGDTLQKIAAKKGIKIEFQPGVPNTLVMVKSAQFQFTIKQLITNAFKAMKEQEEKKISVSSRLLDNNMVEILFQDFGPGISEDNRASVFRRSFTTKGSGGYGLLFIRQMVEDMQGSITLLPHQPGKGAAFLMQLPAVTPRQEG